MPVDPRYLLRNESVHHLAYGWCRVVDIVWEPGGDLLAVYLLPLEEKGKGINGTLWVYLDAGDGKGKLGESEHALIMVTDCTVLDYDTGGRKSRKH